MKTAFNHLPNTLSGRFLKALCGLWLSLATTLLSAAPVIKGDLYGGGKQGSIASETSDKTANRTQISLKAGQVRTVFGGGHEGKVYGVTHLVVEGGVVGDNVWDGTVYGGVYGAGEGLQATVFGTANVSMHSGVVYNNLYGGGKHATLEGNTNVHLTGGQVKGAVYGGARLANIKGRSYVWIEGRNDENNQPIELILSSVYGGNDVSGRIELDPAVVTKPYETIPVPSINQGDNWKQWNAFVRVTSVNQYPVIAQLYGGGNGDYTYVPSGNQYEVSLRKLTDYDENNQPLYEDYDRFLVDNRPELPKVLLDVQGGTYAHVYGGGNNATVTGSTDIYLNLNLNQSPATISEADFRSLNIYDREGEDYLLDQGLVTPLAHVSRLFGGNNKAAMHIRPTWHLESGRVGNLYSGGNQGDMTSPSGLLLPVESDQLYVRNVYGGCRMADVNPSNDQGGSSGPGDESYLDANGRTIHFLNGYAARVYIGGGHVQQVYGGNDVSGKVYYGTNVEVWSDVSGNVYGAGNGSYAYTDQLNWVNEHPEDADYYYAPGSHSLEALFNHRPHVAKTLVHISGTDTKTTHVAGGVYGGGNSATLSKNGDLSTASATIRIGKNVLIASLFMGSNGEHMTRDDLLTRYANDQFSSIDLTHSNQFASYMKAVSMGIFPSLEWEWNATEGTLTPEATQTGIVSFYGGGNVGSMLLASSINLTLPSDICIYDKVVGGCNQSYLPATQQHAAYEGGLFDPNAPTTPSLNLTVNSRLEPKTLTIASDEQGYFESASLDWNLSDVYYTSKTATSSMLRGANIYGGCYTSGVVYGDVRIQLNRDLISPLVTAEQFSEAHADYVFSRTMSVYGGGYGAASDVRGNTLVELTQQARVLKVFGGGEEGKVTGNTMVRLHRNLVKPTEEGRYNIYKVYGGAYEGLIQGDVNLVIEGGRLVDAFGGSCNADINGSVYTLLGHAELAGSDSYLIERSVYGGNDFGGNITGSRLYTQVGHQQTDVRAQVATSYFSGLIRGDLFAGSNGGYDYDQWPTHLTQALHYPVINTDLQTESGEEVSNTFLLIATPSVKASDRIVGSAYGGGKGYPNYMGLVDVGRSYVRLAATATKQQREDNQAGTVVNTVYGGGYYSSVHTTQVHAEKGYYQTLYGGTQGLSSLYPGLNPQVSYNCQHTHLFLYDGIDNGDLSVFGAGALSGVDGDARVTLYGGLLAYAYGGSFNEGHCANTYVSVPEGSTVQLKGLYGGSVGYHDGLPCDVSHAHIDIASSTAYIGDAVFGGNRTARATLRSTIDIRVPLRKVVGGSELVEVYGGGDGLRTITGYTQVNLSDQAQVQTIYGGARDGKVYNRYDYYHKQASFYDAPSNKQYYAHWSYDPSLANTEINLYSGSLVLGHVYGGGKGTDALVAGKTSVRLLGGEVMGNLYGGGYAGPVRALTPNDLACSTDAAQDGNQSLIESVIADEQIVSQCMVSGGKALNVYGGCYAGDVQGDTYVYLGERMTPDGKVLLNNQLVEPTFAFGCPTILRSAYGGGEKGAVRLGTTHVVMYNGYVGYDYDGTDYLPNLKLNSSDQQNLLSENGNLYGGGYGEGAWTQHTHVAFHGGRIRNSLYGGGEIASVGKATMAVSTGSERSVDWNQPVEEGSTLVEVFGGLVERDVFGGGRGFSYTIEGALELGKVSYTDGYVFGCTEVRLHRGTVGTANGLANGYGNVFGGGNIGYVFSVKGQKAADGYYYDNQQRLTEDCKVEVSPCCVALAAVNINGTSYQAGDYVPISDLNTLPDSDNRWNSLDDLGINIQNAVFAGGNVTQGSDIVYANVKTVYGNVTASVIDVYDRDLVVLSNDGIGGLYGDGNLTLVDGYRELNITNYGTDYHNLSTQITFEEYRNMHPRKRSYYELKYTCLQDHIYRDTNDKIHYYKAGDQIAGSVFDKMEGRHPQSSSGQPITTIDEQSYWELAGFATLYAGRMMNTIQRADFCGIFGSRIVLKGARDRVTSQANFTQYTLNRVGELSLNSHQLSVHSTEHGCYFGIYNVVNLLGALTSDLDFYEAIRQTDNNDPAYMADGSTYEQWKANKQGTRFRNNGNSPNIVALASGVWLELVESYAPDGSKNYGPITGVVQLDLINVTTGEGGGYVYAKNLHGDRRLSNAVNVTLAASNEGAASMKHYLYDGERKHYATSGNFVHNLKQIFDDCFPHNGDLDAPAHYWFIRGDYYVYNQTISAYTGSAQAYSEVITIPLSINAGANGRLQLQQISDCYYAYFEGKQYGGMELTKSDSIRLSSGQVFRQNDPISSWDYERLQESEQEYFVPKTYVCVADVVNVNGEAVDVNQQPLGNYAYRKGDVILPETYQLLQESGIRILVHQVDGGSSTEEMPLSDFFHLSNQLSTERGFLLTSHLTNPNVWNRYYTAKSAAPLQYRESDYNQFSDDQKKLYSLAPTFYCVQGGIYGQRAYKFGDLVQESVKSSQESLVNEATQANLWTPDIVAQQATFERAYVATENVHIKTTNAVDLYVTAGNVISETDYLSDLNAGVRDKFQLAYLCVETFQYDEHTQYFYGDIIPQTEYHDLSLEQSYFTPVYVCTQAGDYGGSLFRTGQNYLALQYCALNQEERTNFSFNKDALDLFSQGFVNQFPLTSYDPLPEHDPIYHLSGRYSDETLIDYIATYMGTEPIDMAPYGAQTLEGNSLLTTHDVLDNVNYERLINEKRNYARVDVTDETLGETFYVVHTMFKVGDTYYNKGNVLTATTYASLGSPFPEHVDAYHFLQPGTYYACMKDYVSMNEIHSLAQTNGGYDLTTPGASYSAGSMVPKGCVISKTVYEGNVTNLQANFSVNGATPHQTSTLYVARETDIRDLSADRILTMVYSYAYTESDQMGNNFEEIVERHVVNIRIHFESGVPTVGDLQTPQAVLPGHSVGINTPVVVPGAYEIMGGGFEIYTNEADAFAHKNGSLYVQNNHPLYWYQNDYWVAYYAKTYLGKTYSNPIKLTVANYHRMEDVLKHPEHLYVDSIFDNQGQRAMQRHPKIYLDNHECADADYNELDYFYDFFQQCLTVAGEDSPEGRASKLNDQIRNGQHLEFILQDDLSPKHYAGNWPQVGTAEHCFEGRLHGNGHTIEGLNVSLFGHLCGDVYNLGVTGDFTGAGLSDHGARNVENVWVASTSPADNQVYAVVGDNTGRVRNAYYHDSQAYRQGQAIAMPTSSFVNGLVAYRLNYYYLQKREDFLLNRSWNGFTGKCWVKGESWPVSTGTQGVDLTDPYLDDYVGSYYGDGDFRYAKGAIPTTRNVRFNTQDGQYYPIYPDDYIFFGQNLSYNLVQNKPHDDSPTSILRVEQTYPSTLPGESGVMLDVDLIDIQTRASNRIYRAPAYFQSKWLAQGVYFNREAVLVDAYQGNDIYKGMTAIDLSGYVNPNRAHPDPTFFGPWLDYNGLLGFATQRISRNMLIYNQEGRYPEADNILSLASNEPTYATIDANLSVAPVSDIHLPNFHLVNRKDDDTFEANTDHLLVDGHPFNAPIAYRFAKDNNQFDCFMWHQRTPSVYANGQGGWESICLPFTSSLVTTHQKGELTHFFGNSTLMHEYWLRGLQAVGADLQTDAQGHQYVEATFHRPIANEDNRYVVGQYAAENTFLYDYYYQYNNAHDAKGDLYKDYYSSGRHYQDYVYLTASVPYLIAFPGESFYEFDLSGQFVPAHTANPTPNQLSRQVLTFVSPVGAQIAVSDDELCRTEKNGYAFVGSYQVQELDGEAYVLTPQGTAFEKQTGRPTTTAFRALLMTAPSTRSASSNFDYVSISSTDAPYQSIEESSDNRKGRIVVFGRNQRIHIVSQQKQSAKVSIYSISGRLLQTIDLPAHETVVVPMENPGVYLVDKQKVIL